MDLSSIQTVTNDDPPRILVYGPPGMAKTTLASEFPDAVFLQTERGTPSGVEIAAFPFIDTYQKLIDSLIALYQGEHPYRWVVIDTLDNLEALVWKETCRLGIDGKTYKSIEEFGYGKGYKQADIQWGKIIAALNALRAKGMGVILIGHSEDKRFDDPMSVSYDRYQLNLHERASNLLYNDMDAILFMNKRVDIKEEDQGFNKKRAVGAGGASIWIHTQGVPAYVAKNRYRMPDKVLFTEGQGFSSLAPYFPEAYRS